MEYVVQALKVLRNLVHAETNARCPKTGVLDVPEGVKLPRLSERFREFCPLIN